MHCNNNNTVIQWSNINYSRDLDKKNAYLKLVGNYKGAMMHGLKKCKALNPKAQKVANLQTKIKKLWTKKTKTIDEFETHVQNVKTIKVYMVINPTNM